MQESGSTFSAQQFERHAAEAQANATTLMRLLDEEDLFEPAEIENSRPASPRKVEARD